MGTVRSVRKHLRQNGIGTNERLRQQYIASVEQLTAAERIKGLVQNGITPRDVDEAHKSGYSQGRESSAKPYIRVYCAAMLIAMWEKLNPGTENCGIVISRALEILNGSDWLTPEELEEKAAEMTGVELKGLDWT